MASWLIRDIVCPDGVWTPLTQPQPPDLVRLANIGRVTVWLKPSFTAPGDRGGARPLAPGAMLSRDDLVLIGIPLWARPEAGDGLLAIEALWLTNPAESFSPGFGPGLN